MLAAALGVACAPAPAHAVSVGPQEQLDAGKRLPADFYPGGFKQGNTIPRGYAVVLRRVSLGGRPTERHTRLTCPSGMRMRSLATSTYSLGFLVPRSDRRYPNRLRTVRMTVFAVAAIEGGDPTRPPVAQASAARTPTLAGLCRRTG